MSRCENVILDSLPHDHGGSYSQRVLQPHGRLVEPSRARAPHDGLRRHPRKVRDWQGPEEGGDCCLIKDLCSANCFQYSSQSLLDNSPHKIHGTNKMTFTR